MPVFVVAPATTFFLARVTMEPRADWDFGARLGHVGIVVERGVLTIVAPTGERERRRADDGVELRSTASHRVQNADDSPLAFLLYGLVPTNQAGSSILEIHRAACPPGAREPYYLDCHHLGQQFVPYELSGPRGYSARESTEITVSEMVKEPGPGIALFRGLGAGRYHLDEAPMGQGDQRVYVYCADRTAGPTGDGLTLAEFRGAAGAGIDIEIPAAAYVVCDWYAGIT